MTEPERLKLIRTTLGLNQKEFSEALGIRQPTLSAIESGKTGVSNKLRKTAVKVFHINAAWLLDGSGNMFSAPLKKYKEDKDHLIAVLQDQVNILKAQIADKDRIIKLLSDKSRTNSTPKTHKNKV